MYSRGLETVRRATVPGVRISDPPPVARPLYGSSRFLVVVTRTNRYGGFESACRLSASQTSSPWIRREPEDWLLCRRTIR